MRERVRAVEDLIMPDHAHNSVDLEEDSGLARCQAASEEIGLRRFNDTQGEMPVMLMR